MTVKGYIISFLNYMLFLPATLLCYVPAKNHLRFRRSRIVLIIAALSVAFSAILSFFTAYFPLDDRILFLPFVALMFVVYHKSTTLHISQSAAIFLLVCNFTTFFGNFAIVYDAFSHPALDLTSFSPTACVFLFVSFTLFCAVCVYPTSKYGSFLLDHLQQPRVWWASVAIAVIFYSFNLSMVVHQYSTLHTNMVGIAYITVMALMFVLLLLLCVIFYFIVNALIKKAEAEDRNHILEMQEKQYEDLQRYLDADAKARHDFRQTIYTLKELSSEKNISAIDEYLSRYMETLPQKETVDYCRDHALNALLNHYVRRAEQNSIRTEIQVNLPETLYVDSVDLCSIIGNILENAIAACCDIPEEKRFIRLVLSEEQGSELYIAISNSFSGELLRVKDRYLSTHKGGSGIGLVSIAATAERYGGSANYSHDGGVFYSDVMLEDRKSEAITA